MALTIDASKLNVLILGDVMLDRYWHGETGRISPEAPVPVVHINQNEERPGGAGNVALNVSALGCETALLGLVGDDEAADVLENKLLAANINSYLTRIKNLPTITKLRVLSQHQQLIRLDFEESFQRTHHDAVFKQYQNKVKDVDVVILSDYGKGTLQQSKALIQIANEHNVPVLVDPKNKDFSLYKGATLMTPNLKEFEQIVGRCHVESTLLSKARNVLAEYQLKAILITRGSDGMTLIQMNEPAVHLPAHAKEVFDVTGAGDTVIATLAMCVAAGMRLKDSAYYANWAASIVVGKLGAATVTMPELRRMIRKDLSLNKGVMTQEQLLLIREDAKSNGERVVMTNGCFDILHAGHVAYLKQAKALGDRLIVAVNDDDSVRRLKGVGRPINTLHKRMAVLAALSTVDWVVPFSEDTPREILSKVLPDILVKGGDYDLEHVVGADIVKENGGDVKILDFIEGYSTTNIVDKIKQNAVEKEEIT